MITTICHKQQISKPVAYWSVSAFGGMISNDRTPECAGFLGEQLN